MASSSRLQKLSLLASIGLLVTIVHSSLVSTPVEADVSASSPACNDGIDNDLDGYVDYPYDHDCLSVHDNFEQAVQGPVTVVVTDGVNDALPGETLTYNITIRSHQLSAENENIRFYIPDNADFMSATDNAHQHGSYIEWRNIYVHPETPRTLTAYVKIRKSAQFDDVLVAEAEVVGKSIARDTTVVYEEEPILLEPLLIAVDDGKTFTNVDEEIHYQIFVENTTGYDREFEVFTTLPPFVSFLSATGDFKRKQRSIEWNHEFIRPGETIVYDIYGIVERDAPNHTSLTLKASTGPSTAQDTTTVIDIDTFPAGSIVATINDGLTEARPGEEVTYAIHLQNFNTVLATNIEVANTLPLYTEFVDASEGGQWTGTDIRWKGLTISPEGDRTLYVTVRIRRDAPLGANIKNSVNVQGQVAVDLTTVTDTPATPVAQQPVHTGSTYKNAILRKTADRKMVNPGDIVHYTIYLKNTFDHALTDLYIEDRMNSSEMTILNAQQGQMMGDALVWTVPELAPGAEWSVQYSARINEGVRRGIEIGNIVTVTGNGLETLSLTERVRTSHLNVVTHLPRSGAPLDVIFALLFGGFGLAPTFVHRRALLS